MQSTILIDRDRFFIEGLRRVLAETGQFTVLGVGHEEQAALSLVNVAMPAAVLAGLNVVEQGDPEAFVAALRQRAPQSRLVVFADHPCEPELSARLQSAGACVCLSRRAEASEILAHLAPTAG